MINLRYHLVSITAIFLALGIGVALGGTFLDNYTVDQLNSNISGAEARIHKTEAENAALKRQISHAADNDKALTLLGIQSLYRDRLTDKPVLLVTSDGVDKASLDTLRAGLVGAGADFKGTLVMTDKLAQDPDTAPDLADTLGLPRDTPSTSVRHTMVSRLARAFVTAGTPTTDTSITPPRSTTTAPAHSAPTTSGPDETSSTTTAPTTTRPTTSKPKSATSGSKPTGVHAEPEVLTALRADGYLRFQPPDGGSKDDLLLTTNGYRFVFVSGPNPALPDSDLLLPMLRAMASVQDSVPAVVASAAVGDDPDHTRTAVVGPIRDDDQLRRAVSTVDDLESFSGLTATVLAVEGLDNNIHGHYGVGDGATSQLPTES